MTAETLYAFNSVNLDSFTENFSLDFYLSYLATWPDLCLVCEGDDGTVAGYILGKVEGLGRDWHGHVTAISVAPAWRGKGVAGLLMSYLEEASKQYKTHFVDLFVRAGNEAALNLYRKRGYVVHKHLKSYYSDGEAAYDMRLYFHQGK